MHEHYEDRMGYWPDPDTGKVEMPTPAEMGYYPPMPRMGGVPKQMGSFGVSLGTEVELGPTTLQVINDTKRMLDQKLDVVSGELASAVKLGTVGIVLAAALIAAGLILKK